VTPPEPTDTFLTVARQLIASAGEDPAWAGCRNASYRSAASRAYYAGLIALRTRLQPHLVAARRQFPAAGTHSLVKRALHAAGHTPLAARFEELRRARERADYEWGPTWTQAQASDAVRVASVIHARVHALSDRGLSAIAAEL
jgi:hypothetical protein